MTYFLHIFPRYARRRMFSINWTFCIFFIVFSRFLNFSYPKKKARTKQTARKSNKGLPKATKGEQGGKGGGSGIASGRSGGGSGGGGFGGSGGSSGGVGGSDRNRNTKGNVRVDVSFNNWKIDLQLQPLSGKSHTCGLSRK